MTLSHTHPGTWAAGFLSEAESTSVPQLKPQGQVLKFLFSSLSACEVGKESSPQVLEGISDSSGLRAPHDRSILSTLSSRQRGWGRKTLTK